MYQHERLQDMNKKVFSDDEDVPLQMNGFSNFRVLENEFSVNSSLADKTE